MKEVLAFVHIGPGQQIGSLDTHQHQMQDIEFFTIFHNIQQRAPLLLRKFLNTSKDFDATYAKYI